MAHHRFIDLTGKRFNRWLVIEQAPRQTRGQSRWKCRCDCGSTKDNVLYGSLVRGASQSCGCLRIEMITKTDGVLHSSKNPVYVIWQTMKTRCYNKKHPSFKHYGSRGIGVSAEWRDNFDIFSEDMGPRPSPDHSLERKDNNKGYSKENCVWATRDEQSSNKRSNIKYEWKGELRTLTQIARMENVDYCRLYLYSLNTPVGELVTRLQKEGKTFHERAKGMGATGSNRTGQKRTRHLFGGRFVLDPLADIW